MKCSSPASTKASSNGSGVRKHVSGISHSKNDFAPCEIMNVRWLASLQKDIPSVDFEDLNTADEQQDPRQFAPEFSQKAYSAMISRDIVIGNYINGQLTRAGFASSILNSEQRE